MLLALVMKSKLFLTLARAVGVFTILKPKLLKYMLPKVDLDVVVRIDFEYSWSAKRFSLISSMHFGMSISFASLV